MRGKIGRRDYMVEGESGPLFVREIRPHSRTVSSTALFVHGNTFPSQADFDLPLQGCSYVEYLAGRGITSFIFDHRGYGRSCKPGRDVPVELREKTADLAAVYRFLVDRQRIDSIVLVGLSSGCNTVAEFLAQPHPEVASIAFLGPCYLANPLLLKYRGKVRLLRLARALMGRSSDCYVSFSRAALEKRLYRGEERVVVREAYDAFVDTAIKTTSSGARKLRSPVLGFPPLDIPAKPWAPIFDAKRIDRPLALFRGERDDFCCEETMRRLKADAGTDRVEVKVFADKKHDMHLYREHDDIFGALGDFATAGGNS